MATRFIQEATNQLAPVYAQQQQAIESQIPAVQQLYTTLLQGLEGQRQTETQNILEGATQRGVLRSSLTTDLQTQLGQALLAERGKLGMQQAQDVAGINERVAGLRVNSANAIADLARSLESQDLDRQKFEFSKEEANRSFELEKQKLAIQRSAAAQAVKQGAPAGLVNNLFTMLNSKKGTDGFVSPRTYQAGLQQWVNANGAPGSYHETFGWAINPTHQKNFGGYY